MIPTKLFPLGALRPTKSLYVTDGLVAWWDGIYNSGDFTHDKNAVVWDDLVGNRTATLLNGAVEWTDKSLKTRMSGQQPDNTQAPAATFSPGFRASEVGTIEIVAKLNQPAQPSGEMLVFVGGYGDFAISAVNGGTAVERARLLNNGTWCNAAAADNRGIASLGQIRYWSFDNVGNKIYRSAREQTVTSVSGTVTTQTDGVGSIMGRTSLGNSSSNHAATADAEIYCIRVYNRELSEIEVMENFAVDYKRFYTKLTYDAEVEYIGATGTQYVNSNVVYTRGQTFSVDVDTQYINVNLNGIALWGASTVTNRLWFGLQNQGVGFILGMGTGNTSVEFPSGFDVYSRFLASVSFAASRRYLSINGAQIWSSNLQPVPSTPIWIGGSCRGPGEENSLSYASHAKIYKCEISRNGVLIRDFVPVRVGQLGALYDQANPDGGPNGDGLYFSEGQHSFYIGRDVSTEFDIYAPGLTMWYDGILNAGRYDSHSSNAGVWKNLALTGSDYDFTLAGTNVPTWSNNALQINGILSYAYCSNLMPRQYIATMEICFEVTSSTAVSSARHVICNLGDRLTSSNSHMVRRGLAWNYNNSKNGWMFCAGNGIPSGQTAPDTIPAGVYRFSVTYPASDSAYASGATPGTIVKDESAWTVSSYLGDSWSGSSVNQLIGSISSARSWTGKIYSIRCYNRQLTRAEMISNQQIDRTRFGLP